MLTLGSPIPMLTWAAGATADNSNPDTRMTWRIPSISWYKEPNAGERATPPPLADGPGAGKIYDRHKQLFCTSGRRPVLRTATRTGTTDHLRSRRLSRPDRPARLPAGTGGEHAVAAAVLSFAGARRRLRHFRLSQRPPGLRRDGGFPQLHRRGPSPRPARDHRTGDQPHLGPASLVPGGAPRAARLDQARLLRVERQRRSTPAPASSSPTPRNPTGPGTRSRRPITGTASSRTSRTSISPIRMCSRR
jgi:hypothetical protein